MKIGDNVKRIREAKNMSRKELYLEAGISSATLFRIENNKLKYFNPDITRKIARCLEVDVSLLIS